jgi:type IV pilus assembly protein PilN
MIRINLLPHREQKRQARQRQFVSLSIGLAILGLALVGLGWVVLDRQIENQENRNALLKSEIAKLDEQIKEIDKLREQTQALLSRKQVVETLQSNRTEAVHVLDQMVRQLPDGIYLKSLKQIGAKITLVGYAQSSARVSTLMRNLDTSPWLQNPELVEIKLVTFAAGERPAGERVHAQRQHQAARGARRRKGGRGRSTHVRGAGSTEHRRSTDVTPAAAPPAPAAAPAAPPPPGKAKGAKDV